MTVWGLILARGGSKGVPRKNLRRICGRSLVARAVGTALGASTLEDVWVSTDDDEIAEVASAAGAKVYRRSSGLAADSASTDAAALEFLRAHTNACEAIALLQATSPLMVSLDIDHAVSLWRSNPRCSVVAVARQRHFRWSSDGHPLNYDPCERPRRQDWTGEFVETGSLYVTATRRFVESGYRCPPPVGLLEIPAWRALEIDEELDLVVASALLKEMSSATPVDR